MSRKQSVMDVKDDKLCPLMALLKSYITPAHQHPRTFRDGSPKILEEPTTRFAMLKNTISVPAAEPADTAGWAIVLTTGASMPTEKSTDLMVHLFKDMRARSTYHLCGRILQIAKTRAQLRYVSPISY